MISLKKLYERIKKEQVPQQTVPTTQTQQMPQQQQVSQVPQMPIGQQTPAVVSPQIGDPNRQEVMTFAEKQYTVSFFPQEKKVVFTPLKGTIASQKLRQDVNKLRNYPLEISRVNSVGTGAIEVVFAPTQNFGKVKSTIKQDLQEKE